jgi:hypothetical protein
MAANCPEQSGAPAFERVVMEHPDTQITVLTASAAGSLAFSRNPWQVGVEPLIGSISAIMPQLVNSSSA